ncbi:MAG: thiamine pyrophosphate-dependent enzyme [Bacteroidia bacterium]
MANEETAKTKQAKELSFDDFRKSVLDDYRIACESRQASLIGRKEVLTGKAKFGIFGDGKEVAQLAMAKAFKEGDFRAGYYRDQTFMFAIGELSIQEYFAQLYANTDKDADRSSQGRLMNGHFSTPLLNADGSWKDLTKQKNSSADISPTAGQMPRLLGLAYASKFYRNNEQLQSDEFSKFSVKGNEVAFGTIGDASTSEGMFWETINAAGVLQVPMAISVWDDGFGISVSQKYQTTKQSISDVLRGFEKNDDRDGYLIYTAKAHDYPGLCATYEKGIAQCRENHTPVLFHIQECTQPQGHSTSGSHERYKSPDRLAWEEEFDCIKKMREFISKSAIATDEELETIEADAKKTVNSEKRKAWDAFSGSVKRERAEAITYMVNVSNASSNKVFIDKIIAELNDAPEPERKLIAIAAKKILRLTINENTIERVAFINWLEQFKVLNVDRYNSHLYSQSQWSAMKVEEVKADYNDDSQMVDGREVLLANFDALLNKYPQLMAFGEDVGKIGGVNQTYAGLQQKYGELRILDTGIRETTIIGQGIGLALRGLRPIAEIQYLDYLIYALTTLSDDLACLHYRTKGGQKAPLIISTRGHRLEGVWHAGSPMSMLLGSLRGIYICVPRNMTQAAGFYNTFLKSDDPALIIECLNGYRLKEKLPANLAEFTVPLGVPEVLMTGDDVTIVTYGSCVRIAQDAAQQLAQTGISCELIDIQTLIPFDINHRIVQSLTKTNRIVFVDEDVNGGATAFMMQKVLEEQGGYKFLDSAPATLSAKDHRPAYGSDGDYFSKSNAEEIFDVVYQMMNEAAPHQFPKLF